MNSEPLRITLLHTNDMHGSLGAMSRLSSVVRRLRRDLEAEGRQVFFFDSGDAADRKLRFCSITKGAAFPRILEAMGYHAQALGNAISITYGPQAAAVMAGRAAYPILAANFLDENGPLVEGFQPAVSFPLTRGQHLGVIGLTVDHPAIYAIFGLHLPEFTAVAHRQCEQLRAQQPGPVILLSHLGIQKDRQTAEAVPEIDVILGGHSHTLLPEGETVNGVLIAQTGDYARYLGRVDLEVDPISGKVLSKQARLIEISEIEPPDPAVEEAVQAAEAEGAHWLAQPLCELADPLPLDHFGECAIGNLAADALRERMGAEVAILSGGLFHRGLPAGRITLGDLDSASFSTANPQLSQVRGEQLLAALERGLDETRMHSTPKAHRGAPMGLPMLSGLQVTLNLQRQVTAVTVQGRPLEPERLYSVAHTDAEVIETDASFGYLILEPGQLLKVEVPTILREALQDYLIAHAPVHAPQDRRWHTDGLSA